MLQSLPSWKRGLKLISRNAKNDFSTSLPSWKRGLKFLRLPEKDNKISRSPRGSVD